MSEQQKWIKWIKNSPAWIKGAVALATAIISFILLFQNNYYLSVTVLGTLLLGAILCLSIYLAFTKRPPLIVGGKEQYRFGRNRYWGVAGILLTIIAMSLTLTSESGRSFVATALIGTATPTITPTPTVVPTPAPTPVPCASIPDDEQQITCLIAAEAKAVLFQNIDRAVAIFREDAVVRDAFGQEWEGSAAIRNRYESLTSVITFVSLQHNIVELHITENEATAKTTLETEYKLRPGLYIEAIAAELMSLPPVHYDSAENIETTGEEILYVTSEERWSFTKSQDTWKVKTFVYGLGSVYYRSP